MHSSKVALCIVHVDVKAMTCNLKTKAGLLQQVWQRLVSVHIDTATRMAYLAGQPSFFTLWSRDLPSTLMFLIMSSW